MSSIVFKINGKQYTADGKFSSDVTLNEYIRTVADLRGTKVMCNEGGCGACIVSVRASLPPLNEAKTFSVNSCLVSVFSCHGWEITTVEGIGNRLIGYHEIQTRLAKFNATQCGYCTPGWVMSMYSLYTSKKQKLTCKEIENSFASNICRCTGYRPLTDALKSFAVDVDKNIMKTLIDVEDLGVFKSCHMKHNKNIIKHKDANSLEDDWCLLDASSNTVICVENTSHKWFRALRLEEVFKIMALYKDYKLIAGNTGQGVYHFNDYPTCVIDIFNVVDIKGYTIDVNLILGGGMPLNEMMEVFSKLSAENEDFAYLKEFLEHMDLVAHIPVRNIGTIGGNLFLKHANHEFPSDLFLLFETVGSTITIGTAFNKYETLTLLDFLKTNMNGKIIVNVMLPPLPQLFCKIKTYKIMPRSQNAHAIVNAGFLFKFKHTDNILDKVSIVYGNINPNFIHAIKTEKGLVNKDPFVDDNLQMALRSLLEEICPESAPPEPSEQYRKLLAVALYYKAILTLCPSDRVNKKYLSGGSVIKRSISQGSQIYDTDKSVWPLNKPIPKVDAVVQCSGEAVFANDLPSQTDEVYGAFVTADVPPGSIIGDFNPSEALNVPGVIAFYSAKDIPGKNNFTPTNISIISTEEEIMCSGEVKFYGQPVGIIVADRGKLATKAAKLVKINYSMITDKTPLLTVDNVLKSSESSQRVIKFKTKEATELGNDTKYQIYDKITFESQYHYTIEPQTCVVKPTEDGLEVLSSTQWLDLTNIAVAQCLNVPVNSVNVVVRRVGGAYGGKITRSSQIACAAAIVTHLLGRVCRFILPIETNMNIAGGRIPTFCDFEVGVDMQGEIQYLKNKYYQDNGCSINESIIPMTLNHFPSCYKSKRWCIESFNVLTDKHSTSWCRAPASTEGIATTEYIMEKIAHETGLDSLKVRLANMSTENNPIPILIDQLKEISDYDNRLKGVDQFNNYNQWRKRALKLIPMTYELFYIGPFNSVISIYHGDGTVVITHGATEIGQGINTKVSQVAAYCLGISLESISVKSSTSFTSPNSMATGASIGSECVSYATIKACEILKERLKPIQDKMNKPSWKELVSKAHNSGVDLQASYMYSPFEPVKPYDIFGVVALEVEVDILTGNHDVRRVDLLEDTGRSLSPVIDVGQIEGAFVMGLGYWTSEKMVFDPNTGKLLTDRTWNYKPPGIKDIPADFRVYFQRNSKNEHGVLQSKATGEPALCLAVAVTHAIREAVRLARLDAGYEDNWITIEHPYTTENIFMAVGHELEHFKLK